MYDNNKNTLLEQLPPFPLQNTTTDMINVKLI